MNVIWCQIYGILGAHVSFVVFCSKSFQREKFDKHLLSSRHLFADYSYLLMLQNFKNFSIFSISFK